MTVDTEVDLATVAAGLSEAIRTVEQNCTDAVTGILDAHPKTCSPITCTESEWAGQQDAFAARDAFYAALMPTEQDAIKLMNVGFDRLKALGWSEAMYCPKDGSTFDAVEVGSTGIHQTHYSGEWPTGSWWVSDAGDLWPSHPVLYRPTEAEKAERERRILALRQHLIDQGDR